MSKNEQHGPSTNPEDDEFQSRIDAGITKVLPGIVDAICERLDRRAEKKPVVESPPKSVHAESSMSSKRKSDSIEDFVESSDPDFVRKKSKSSGCSYKQFVACKPSEFDGSKGPISVVRWLNETEGVLSICECAEENKVKYSAQLFKGAALEWWNSLIETRGRIVMNSIPWSSFRELVIKKYCPSNEQEKLQVQFLNLEMQGTDHATYVNRFLEFVPFVSHLVTPEANAINRYIWGLIPEIRGVVKSSRPATLDAAMEMGGTLTDDYVRRMDSGKGVATDKSVSAAVSGKKDVSASGSKTSTPAGGFYCKKCRKRHYGRCPPDVSAAGSVTSSVSSAPAGRLVCDFCKRLGHTADVCYKKNPTCFNCGERGHLIADCPKKKNASSSGKPGSADNRRNARAFVLKPKDADQLPDVVSGTFLVNNILAKVLFDTGANQSYIDYKFCALLNEPLEPLFPVFEV